MTAHLEDWEKARLAYAEFDKQVRKIGDLEECDKIIAFTNQRPGCIATEDSGRFTCPCGSDWSADDANPPACKDLQVGGTNARI